MAFKLLTNLEIGCLTVCQKTRTTIYLRLNTEQTPARQLLRSSFYVQ